MGGKPVLNVPITSTPLVVRSRAETTTMEIIRVVSAAGNFDTYRPIAKINTRLPTPSASVVRLVSGSAWIITQTCSKKLTPPPSIPNSLGT